MQTDRRWPNRRSKTSKRTGSLWD